MYLTPSSRRPRHGSMNISRRSRISKCNRLPIAIPTLGALDLIHVREDLPFLDSSHTKWYPCSARFTQGCVSGAPDHRFHFLYKCSISILWCLQWVWSGAAVVLTGTLASSAGHPRGSEQCQQGWPRAQAKPHRRCFVANIVYSSRRE